jgi:integrase/recombinase XerD
MRKNLLRVGATGPLVPFVAGFGAELESNGYRASTVANQLLLLVHVSHWLEEQGLGADELTPERTDDFLIVRRAAGYTQWTSAKGMTQLLAHLRRIGAAPMPVPVPTTPVDNVLVAYRNYLLEERGLALTSVDDFVRVARLFLDEHCDATGAHREVAPADVLRFVTEQCRLHNPHRIATGLRAFFRYCHLEGLTTGSLSEVVPRVANWRLSSLPKTLEPEHVHSLLESCDQSTALGARNFAILTVLVRLGLRASEVANLELDDIDWRSGELLVRGNGSRVDRLPLPVDVGEAIVHWLEHGRPQCKHPNVFIRMLAPIAPLSGNGVSDVVRSACRRAGLPKVGSHRLRHTAASEKLRAGSNLTEIGQVLRHQNLATTAIYAKIDHRALLCVAQPSPEAS